MDSNFFESASVDFSDVRISHIYTFFYGIERSRWLRMPPPPPRWGPCVRFLRSFSGQTSSDRELHVFGWIGRSDCYITSDIVNREFPDVLFIRGLEKNVCPRREHIGGTRWIVEMGGIIHDYRRSLPPWLVIQNGRSTATY
jgi:hypothetical protein